MLYNMLNQNWQPCMVDSSSE